MSDILSIPVVPIGIYLFAAFVVPVVARVHMKARWLFALVMGLCSLLFMLAAYPGAQGEHTTYWVGNWIPALGTVTGIGLVLDPLSWLFGILMSLFCVLCIIYSKELMVDEHSTKYYSLLFLVCAGGLGVVLTADLFNLFVFLELFNLAAIGLVAYNRTDRSFGAAFNFLVMASMATSLMLIGIIILYSMTGTLNIAHIAYKLGQEEVGIASLVALALMIVGVGVKTSFFPLHTWMPEAYSSAPHGASMLLIGMKYGTGLYVLLRVLSVVFGFVGMSWFLIFIGMLTMIVGVMMAMLQTDFKRMLSYHAISQLGYMVLAAGLGTVLGMTGSLFHVINHVIYKGMLFLVAGAVIWRTGETDINRMGGLGRYMPLTALAYAVGALSISGVPPFNGFASKWMIYHASFAIHPAITAIALLVSVLTLASFLKVFHAVFLGSGSGDAKEAPYTMTGPMLLLALLCVLFGLFPDVVLEHVVTPAVRTVLNPDKYIDSVLSGVFP
ncbi:MAG: proton-conducting transporter membrane subunit [Candidatus Micrarchaeota archaeon]